METEIERNEVNAKTYSQVVTKISESCIYFQRTHHWSKETVQIDAFAEFWSIALFDEKFPAHCLSIFSGDKKICIQPNQMVYIPPFTMLRWHVIPSIIRWSSFLVRKCGSTSSILNPRILPWLGNTFRNQHQVYEYVLGATPLTQIQPEMQLKIVGLNLKKWIDHNYRKSIRLTDYAEATEVSLAYLIKEFKACYGLTPHAYMNKLRSFEGMFELMLKGDSIGGMSYGLGFKDSSTFYKSFTKEFLASPSEFKISS